MLNLENIEEKLSKEILQFFMTKQKLQKYFKIET